MTRQCMLLLTAAAMILGLTLSTGCLPPPWPDSPLYEPPENDPGWIRPATLAEAKEAIAGHYAHYDIVAYITQVPTGPMRTFIISYGYTDFRLEGDDLITSDRFCFSEHKANQPFVSTFSDAATQAIQPRETVVDVFQEGENWKVWRPATPTLIGIEGDPDQPLSMDPNDPNIIDADGDGNPGVTVGLKLYGLINAELYIARREIFMYDVSLYSDGSLRGHVVDESEQLVIGATYSFLAQPNNPPQYEDYGLSPIMLIPVPESMDTCEELRDNRDILFPPAPNFW